MSKGYYIEGQTWGWDEEQIYYDDASATIDALWKLMPEYILLDHDTLLDVLEKMGKGQVVEVIDYKIRRV